MKKMMKSNQLFAIALAAIVMFGVACDETGSEIAIDENGFIELTDEQNKENMEQAGTKMLDQVKMMENEPAMQANVSLASLVASTGNNEEWKNVNWNNVIGFSQIIASANYENTGFDGMLKSVQISPLDDPETIQEFYDEVIGTFTWNSDISEFEYAEGGDAIVFLFPAEIDGTINNAEYRLTYVGGYTGVNPIDDEYAGDLPTAVNATLTVDGVVVSSFAFSAAYDTQGFPSSVEASYSMGGFVLSAKVSNTNNTGFAGETSFVNGSETLLKLALDASGNWSEENIKNNTKYYVWEYDEETYYYDRVEVSESDYYEGSDIDVWNIVTEGNASFQIMNFEIAGNIDVKGLGDAIELLDAKYDDGEYTEEEAQEEIDVLNENITLHLQYADSKGLIATVEAFMDVYENTYETNYYGGEWYEEAITVTDKNYDLNIRFVFADGTKVDAETYFGDSFDDLLDDLIDYTDTLDDAYDL